MTTRRWRGAPVLVAVALTLAAADHAGSAAPAVDRSRDTVRAALAALEAAVDRPVAAVVAALGRADDLTRENARLRTELARRRARGDWADALARDNVALAGLAGVSAPGGMAGVAARVVALPVGRPGAGLLLDRGTEAGLAPGMPVVAGGALVGRVVQVSPRRARVLPVTDPGSAVGIRLADTGEAGLAHGSGGALRLELLAPDAEATAGALVVTAGVEHGRFPPALPVGRVRPDGRSLAPAVALSRLELVEVLAWQPPG